MNVEPEYLRRLQVEAQDARRRSGRMGCVALVLLILHLVR